MKIESKEKYQLSDEELQLFEASISGTKKLKQDKIMHHYHQKNHQRVTSVKFSQKREQKQREISCYFSDDFHPQLNSEGPIRYIRQDVETIEIRKLRRGDYFPDIFLDLHGFTQRQAKQQLIEMFAVCKSEHIYCASIMHGHGRDVLKKQIPLWLAQHPDVLAFHQAPKKWGGAAALLVLIE
ncbi:endonuclease SmrB [Candidatus Regiella insecticola]|uniref:Ribosome rescue factor SmrB n=1 Tax=Candidatus Regiella insecticola TaxID=138073 RepID=A0A6L2ZNY7_9ENTR|nr:endonuclease SmrB [Candidatus Regiella insecticola]GFN46503.1 smr domain protein [Candidatus Regiella insecticola]